MERIMAKNQTKNILIFFAAILVLSIAGLLPSDAFAQANNFRAQASGVSYQISFLAKLIAFVSYIGGTMFAVKALFALKGFIQSPDDNPANHFIAYATVSCLLILLPYSIGLFQEGLSLSGGKDIGSTAKSFALASCSGSGLNKVFCNLAKEISPFSKLIAVAAFVMAGSFMLTGLLNLKSYGDDPSSMPLRSIIMKFTMATMLISFPLAMNVFISTVTGQSASSEPAKLSKPKLYNGSLK